MMVPASTPFLSLGMSNGEVTCRAHKAFDNELCLTSRSFKLTEIRRLQDEYSGSFRPPYRCIGEDDTKPIHLFAALAKPKLFSVKLPLRQMLLHQLLIIFDLLKRVCDKSRRNQVRTIQCTPSGRDKNRPLHETSDAANRKKKI